MLMYREGLTHSHAVVKYISFFPSQESNSHPHPLSESAIFRLRQMDNPLLFFRGGEAKGLVSKVLKHISR